VASGTSGAAISASTHVLGMSGFQLLFDFCALPLPAKIAQTIKTKNVIEDRFAVLKRI
jgi:hypothetical protein